MAGPVSPPQPVPPPPSDKELSGASSDIEEAMDVVSDGRLAPTTPDAPSAQTIDLSTPIGSQPPSTGLGLPPVTASKPPGSSRKSLTQPAQSLVQH